MTAWGLAVLATLIGGFAAWTLGANSNSPPFAPAIGANAVSTMQAAFLIGLLAGAGALLQGGSISATIGTGLFHDVAFEPVAAVAGLGTGPLEYLFGVELALPGIVLLGVGAGGILAGAWMGSTRLLQATSREYAQLGSRRSIAALVPGFLIAQVAIALGIPISFNNIVISGVIGGGLAAGSAGVSRHKIGLTLGFWVLTLVSSVAVGYGGSRAMHLVFA